MAFPQGFSSQILVPVPAQVETDQPALSEHVSCSERLQSIPCHSEYVKFRRQQEPCVMSVKSENTDILDVIIDARSVCIQQRLLFSVQKLQALLRKLMKLHREHEFIEIKSLRAKKFRDTALAGKTGHLHLPKACLGMGISLSVECRV